VLSPVMAVGVAVGVVVSIRIIVGIRIIIRIWIIIRIVRVRVIRICAGLPAAFRIHYSILRKSDQANRIGP
jgi:hypothetical protein